MCTFSILRCLLPSRNAVASIAVLAAFWCSAASGEIDARAEEAATLDRESVRLSATDLVYRGAFTYPAGDDWAYSGHALAYFPDGDVTGPGDGFPGSLYAAGHDQVDLVGEMSIPAPVVAADFAGLPAATELHGLSDVTEGLLAAACAACGTCECATWDVDGLEYLPPVQKIAWNLRDWYNVGGENLDSLGWSELDLTGARGVWHVGPRPDDAFHSAKTSNYLFRAPEGFAAQHLEGKWLISGNHRLSGSPGGAQGPSMYASAPWADGDPPVDGQSLDALALVYYPWRLACTENDFAACLYPGYRVDDTWGGGAWIEAGGKTGILVAGRKGLGDNCYGTAGVDCQPSLCAPGEHGWHSDPYEPQIVFYDPVEIAEVAAGTRQQWEVLPYLIYRPVTEVFDPDCARLSGVAYDPERQLIYVTERAAGPFGETAVHVWEVQEALFADGFESGDTSAWDAQQAWPGRTGNGDHRVVAEDHDDVSPLSKPSAKIRPGHSSSAPASTAAPRRRGSPSRSASPAAGR